MTDEGSSIRPPAMVDPSVPLARGPSGGRHWRPPASPILFGSVEILELRPSFVWPVEARTFQRGATHMRFMMLIHHDDAALAAAPQKQLWADYSAFNEALAKAEGSSSGIRLQPGSAATTVRQRDGKTQVLDGPYSDTKEQFAG